MRLRRLQAGRCAGQRAGFAAQVGAGPPLPAGDAIAGILPAQRCGRSRDNFVYHGKPLECKKQKNGAGDAERDRKNNVSVSKHIHGVAPLPDGLSGHAPPAHALRITLLQAGYRSGDGDCRALENRAIIALSSSDCNQRRHATVFLDDLARAARVVDNKISV